MQLPLEETATVRTTTTVQTSSASPTEVRLVRRAENLMSKHPLVEGEVTAVGATGVQVRFDVDGQRRSRGFPVGQVFFFRGNQLAAADTHPGDVRIGDQVFVPLPTQAPRQTVAGSRQVLRSRTSVARRHRRPQRHSRMRNR